MRQKDEVILSGGSNPRFVDGETEAWRVKAPAQCDTAVPGRGGTQTPAGGLPPRPVLQNPSPSGPSLCFLDGSGGFDG